MTEKIREQILAVRATGRTNMFDVPTVQYIANEMRLYELVIFLEEHAKSMYISSSQANAIRCNIHSFSHE